MSELQKSVQCIFNDLKDHTYYNIPEYQRGYKWDAENVEVLLDDFRDFHDMIIKSDDKKQFYCLQNITLYQTKNGYNVVDGQQRLTTLVLLLAYLGESDLVREKMKYSIRKNTHQFIFRRRCETLPLIGVK